MFYIYKYITFLFPAVDSEMLILLHTVGNMYRATRAETALSNCFSGDFGCDSNPHFQIFFNYAKF
jgi:hypothetical protein